MPVSKQKAGFKGRRVLITGAGRGIGRAVAVELYGQGAIVYALSKNPDNLKSLKEECPNVRTICVDLSNWEETRKAIENNVDHVDALINNAAVCVSGAFMDVSPETFDKLFNVNLKSVFNVSQVIGKKMIEKGNGGAIVNISSIAGRKAFPGTALYCCTKAALEMLTRSMAQELGPHKITVNSICPAAVETDMLRGIMDGTTAEKGAATKLDSEGTLKMLEAMTPTRTLYMPMDELVHTIAFFASGATTQITGESIALDGGFSTTS